MPSRLTLLLGKPPRPATLLAELAADLSARGWTVTVRLPHEEAVRAEDLTAQALVVHRGLSAQAADLLAELDGLGVPLCNPWEADRLLRDRRAWRAALAAAGVPMPPSAVVERWIEVLDGAGEPEVVAKALAGPGRGAWVVTGSGRTLPREAPFPGPYLVEPRLPTDGTDRKLYVAGDAVRGLLKPSTLQGPHTAAGQVFEPDAELVELALRTGHALGAHLYGVDLLQTPGGPVVVDVNAFPGYRGVPGAAAAVGDHLARHARS